MDIEKEKVDLRKGQRHGWELTEIISLLQFREKPLKAVKLLTNFFCHIVANVFSLFFFTEKSNDLSALFMMSVLQESIFLGCTNSCNRTDFPKFA